MREALMHINREASFARYKFYLVHKGREHNKLNMNVKTAFNQE